MKIGGKQPGKFVDDLLIVRPSGKFVLRIEALNSLDEFNALWPEPIVPEASTPDGPKPHPDHPVYKQAKADREAGIVDYYVLKGLAATPDLEWDTVKMSDHNTWKNWRKEALEAGFSIGEISQIVSKVLEVNSLDQDKIDKAREDFLIEKSRAEDGA